MWYDLFIGAILLFAVFRGAQRGAVFQVAAIASVVLCFVFAEAISAAVGPIVPLAPPLNNWVVMVGAYLVFSFASFGFARVLQRWIEAAGMIEFNKHVGGAFGFVKGVALALVITFFAVTLSPKSRALLNDSRSGHLAANIMWKLHPVMPVNLQRALEKYTNALETPPGQTPVTPFDGRQIADRWGGGSVPAPSDPGDGFGSDGFGSDGFGFDDLVPGGGLAMPADPRSERSGETTGRTIGEAIDSWNPFGREATPPQPVDAWGNPVGTTQPATRPTTQNGSRANQSDPWLLGQPATRQPTQPSYRPAQGPNPQPNPQPTLRQSIEQGAKDYAVDAILSRMPFHPSGELDRTLRESLSSLNVQDRAAMEQQLQNARFDQIGTIANAWLRDRAAQQPTQPTQPTQPWTPPQSQPGVSQPRPSEGFPAGPSLTAPSQRRPDPRGSSLPASRPSNPLESLWSQPQASGPSGGGVDYRQVGRQLGGQLLNNAAQRYLPQTGPQPTPRPVQQPVLQQARQPVRQPQAGYQPAAGPSLDQVRQQLRNLPPQLARAVFADYQADVLRQGADPEPYTNAASTMQQRVDIANRRLSSQTPTTSSY